MVHQAVWHAFVSHASVMTNTIHNALIKTLDEGGFQGYTGPAYHQTSQMNFTPIGSATTTPPVVSQSQPKGSIGVTQPIGSTVLPQFNLVFTNSTPLTTSMQGGFALGYPLGWDPATSLGMPPEIFFPSGAGQTSASASQPIPQQENADVVECVRILANGPDYRIGFPADAASVEYGNADTTSNSHRNPDIKIVPSERG